MVWYTVTSIGFEKEMYPTVPTMVFSSIACEGFQVSWTHSLLLSVTFTLLGTLFLLEVTIIVVLGLCVFVWLLYSPYFPLFIFNLKYSLRTSLISYGLIDVYEIRLLILLESSIFIENIKNETPSFLPTLMRWTEPTSGTRPPRKSPVTHQGPKVGWCSSDTGDWRTKRRSKTWEEVDSKWIVLSATSQKCPPSVLPVCNVRG